MTTEGPAYGFNVRLPGVPMEEAKRRVADALAEQGFGILTEIDVAATMQKKLGETFRPYLILGACNPKIAHRALSADPGIGLLLPCNVCLWQDGDATFVSIADPRAMFQVVDSGPAALEAVAAEARERLKAVHARLAKP